MKSAKEMFEKLDFKQEIQEEKIIYKRTINKNQIKTLDEIIVFNIVLKYIMITDNIYINKKLLEAIEKQFKELNL